MYIVEMRVFTYTLKTGALYIRDRILCMTRILRLLSDPGRQWEHLHSGVPKFGPVHHYRSHPSCSLFTRYSHRLHANWIVRMQMDSWVFQPNWIHWSIIITINKIVHYDFIDVSHPHYCFHRMAVMVIDSLTHTYCLLEAQQGTAIRIELATNLM